MKLKFTKMQGLGNDFVVFDAIRQHVKLSPEQLRLVADRHFGIGSDQIVMVEKTTKDEADFFYRVFNADGSAAELSGNGARCFAKFVLDEKLTTKTTIRAETVRGIITLRIEPNGLVTVDMGAPRFEPRDIPFLAEKRQAIYSLNVNGATHEFSVLSMGNPHAVQVVENVDRAPVATEGPLIEHHGAFPARVNAGFMQVVDRGTVRLRVYERGAGETLACGTGACAAVVAGIQRDLLDGEVRVHTRGGELSIRWAGEGQPVFMTGAATTVFSGEIDLQE